MIINVTSMFIGDSIKGSSYLPNRKSLTSNEAFYKMKNMGTKVNAAGSYLLVFLALWLFQCQTPDQQKITLKKESRIILIGNNLGSRMMNYGHFETELHLRYPDSLLYIRNMCDPGDTPGFRPHAGRKNPWAFPGAEKFQTELATNSGSEGHFESPDEWLSRHETDIIIAFFGYNESFEGAEGVSGFKAELEAFINHTKNQFYNGESAPELAIISPIAFQDLSDNYNLPDGKKENKNLKLYTDVMRKVAQKNQTTFIDAFEPTRAWFNDGEKLTIDGFQLTDEGYFEFATLLADKLFGKKKLKNPLDRPAITKAVLNKNWLWHNDYKMPNGIHAFGRRHEPFGSDNYPAEIAKIRQMTANRDTAIWQTVQGKAYDLKRADLQTTPLPEIETNYLVRNEEGEIDNGHGSVKYLYGEDALSQLHVADGYQINLFASEKDFEHLANPVQLSFDNRGRLWVATMPSYPHYKPGDMLPDDKLIILEDTDNDGKADKEIVFADGLHLPLGFEFAPEGVYVSQGTNLILLTDTDGDDKADEKEIILSGFDDHDTHHAHSAYCADPSGAIFMAEGLFLHTNVETPYGPVRATGGGFYRYSPQRKRLERTAQLSIPNPWGIAFDAWEQPFFAETSGPEVNWMMPGTVKPRYGVATHKSYSIIEEAHRVRPTSGMEFVSSSHFPPEVQGDLLINNTIGFLGTKQHEIFDQETGYGSKHRQDLVWSDDKNFRPVDMEFAPDGSLFLVDWHNVLIGHMQHNARDPLRDHAHGRIYRITYPSRPLVTPAKVHNANIEELLNNLRLHEYRTRYRSRRALREFEPSEVMTKVKKWVNELGDNDTKYEQYLLEALWVTWAMNNVDESLLRRLLDAEDFNARTAAIRVLRYANFPKGKTSELLIKGVSDSHSRVRLESIVAASWIDKTEGLKVLNKAKELPMDKWMEPAFETAIAHLNGGTREEQLDTETITDLKGIDKERFLKGQEIYKKDGYCTTCHQPDGKGLSPSGFPPLAGANWVIGNEDRLIKLTMHGLLGPIEVLGESFPGQVPMTPFGGILDDEELAAVLTYVRKSFGNNASVITKEQVQKVREKTKDRKGFYSPEELLEMYPME